MRGTDARTACAAQVLRHAVSWRIRFTSRRGPIVHTAILIVDDDPDIRESLGDMLLHEGYIVESAASGEEALHQAKQKRFQAAILDIQLPDLNGLSVLKVLT